MDEVSKIISKIGEISKNKRLTLVGIDGRGGAGKTTLALLVKKSLPSVKIVTMDDFYDDKMKRIDFQKMYLQVLNPLVNNKPASYQEFLGNENR